MPHPPVRIVELFGGPKLTVSAGPTPIYNLIFFDLAFPNGTGYAFAAEPEEAALLLKGIEEAIEIVSDPPAEMNGGSRRVLEAGRTLRRVIRGDV
jgi:hypothetical protein